MTTGLVWLIWRRQRVALILSAVLAVASAVTLIILHAQLVAAAQAAGLAHCLDTPCDRDTLMPFREATMSRASLWSLVLAGRALGPGHFWATVTSLDGGLLKQSTIAPLVGLICGVGLFGREFDQRTRVFALTQATSKPRWWTAALLAVGVPVGVGIGALSVLSTWALHPYIMLMANSSRVSPAVLAVTGIIPVAQFVLAFAVAAAAGILTRATLPAIVATVIIAAALLTALPTIGYLPTHTLSAPFTTMQIDEHIPAHGPGHPSHIKTTEQLVYVGPPPGGTPTSMYFRDAHGTRIDSTELLACQARTHDEVGCLRARGVVSTEVEYLPDQDYWPLQTITTLIYLALAALATLAGWLGLHPSATRQRGTTRREPAPAVL